MIWIIAVLAVSLPVLGFANGQYQSPQPHPAQQYGPSPQPPQQYGPPPQPPQQYGPPPQPPQQYGPPPQPPQQYGPPPQPPQQYGTPPQPSQQYGPPPQPPQQYGPPPQPPQQYGPPPQPPQQYGPPPSPHYYGPPQQYGPPSPPTSSHRVIPQHGDVITISGPPSYSPAYPAESHQHYPDDHYHEQSQQNNDQQHYHEQHYGDQGYADYDQFGLYNHFKGVGDDQKSVDLSSPGYGPPSPQYGPQPQFVPVIIHKNDKKKRKTLSVQKGFFAPGGTQMFGKFKDLFSCMKACELTATCFAGDFDPWQQKCFSHSNHSACAAKRIHPSITHFSKVPCELIETGRGLITLGAQTFRGIEVKGVDTLKECLKACTTAGGGIASSPSTITSTPQICFGIDYDFGGHKCYIHTDSTPCIVTTATISTPQTLVANPSTVSIILCPKAATP